MRLSSGQQEFLLEMLSYEYVIPEEYSAALKQAIQLYATTSYTEDELDFLVTNPQSLAALLCYYAPDHLQSFANQYALWLNCVEQNIYQDDPTIEAILVNPDPTSEQKLLAIAQEAGEYVVIPLPQLIFPNKENQVRGIYSSRWNYQDAIKSLHGFMDYAQQEQSYSRRDSRTLAWPQLLQQGKLFSMIKDGYVFADKALGLLTPQNLQFIQQLHSVISKPQQGQRPKQAMHRGYLSSPPAHPFQTEMNLANKLKQSMQKLPAPPMPQLSLPTGKHPLPPFPARPHLKAPALPPLPFSKTRMRTPHQK